MSTEYARLVWRRYLVEDRAVKSILKVEEPDELASPTSPIANPAVGDVEANRASSASAMSEVKEDCTRGNLIEVNAEEPARVGRSLCDLHGSCRVKRWKVPKKVVGAVDLAVELVDDTVASPPGAWVLLIRVSLN